MSDSLNKIADSETINSIKPIISSLCEMQKHNRNLINKINFREPSLPHKKRLGNIPQNKQI